MSRADQRDWQHQERRHGAGFTTPPLAVRKARARRRDRAAAKARRRNR